MLSDGRRITFQLGVLPLSKETIEYAPVYVLKKRHLCLFSFPNNTTSSQETYNNIEKLSKFTATNDEAECQR